MKAALADSALTDNSVDLILKAINDMQDKITSDTDKKLENFVKKPEFNDLDNLVGSMQRRISHNEGIIKGLDEAKAEHSALIEANRKRIARLQADLDALNRGQRAGGS